MVRSNNPRSEDSLKLLTT